MLLTALHRGTGTLSHGTRAGQTRASTPASISRSINDGTGKGLRLFEPGAERIITLIISMLAACICFFFFAHRALAVKNWSKVPWLAWIVFCIYADSFFFILSSSILQFGGFNLNTNFTACQASTILCLAGYVTTKVFIYLFLVDRAHIVRDTTVTRLKSKLYLFNSFGMMSIYVVFIICFFVYRINVIENGLCVIGVQQPFMIPQISIDVIINVYLTILFLIPLMRLYMSKVQRRRGTLSLGSADITRTTLTARLQKLAIRTFVGSCCTLASTVANLSALTALDGEPAWLCLLCCKSDILFSVVVIHWVTSKDNAASVGSKPSESMFTSGTSTVGAMIRPEFTSLPEATVTPALAQRNTALTVCLDPISINSPNRPLAGEEIANVAECRDVEEAKSGKSTQF